MLAPYHHLRKNIFARNRQCKPGIVANYFQGKHVQYAAKKVNQLIALSNNTINAPGSFPPVLKKTRQDLGCTLLLQEVKNVQRI